LNEDLFKFSPDGTVIVDGLNKTFNITETEYDLSFKKIKPSTPAPPNASEGWFKKTIKKINVGWYLAFADFVLGQGVEIVKKYIKTEKEYKRKVMDRMDSNHRQDPTGADYRGYRGRWQVLTRVAHYLRKVSAIIEDNMFLMGMGVDGCGNIHRFLEPNRRGIFTDENYNADAIIWRIIDNQNLDLDGLILLDNLINLDDALIREIDRTVGVEHQLIHWRLINRRDEIETRIVVIESEVEEAAAEEAEEEEAEEAAADLDIDIQTVRERRGRFNDENYNEGEIIWHIITGQRLDLHGLTLDNLRDLYRALNREIEMGINAMDYQLIPERLITRRGRQVVRAQLIAAMHRINHLITEKRAKEEAEEAAAEEAAAEEAAAAYLRIADIGAVRERRGNFEHYYRNYNAEEIIWHIITDRNLDVRFLILRPLGNDNLRDLYRALDRVVYDIQLGNIPQQILDLWRDPFSLIDRLCDRVLGKIGTLVSPPSPTAPYLRYASGKWVVSRL
jgi:hypothetical protein